MIAIETTILSEDERDRVKQVLLDEEQLDRDTRVKKTLPEEQRRQALMDRDETAQPSGCTYSFMFIYI